MGLADAQIAGICVVSGSVLATRDVRDFDRVAAPNVVNPRVCTPAP
jgi:predicted nucleic acid-binding protein